MYTHGKGEAWGRPARTSAENFKLAVHLSKPMKAWHFIIMGTFIMAFGLTVPIGIVQQLTPISNATSIPSPTGAVSDWLSIIRNILWIASAVGTLLGYLKDRGWKKKYKGVIVARPL